MEKGRKEKMIDLYWKDDKSKARIVSFLLYPDSCNPDFRDYLKEMNIKCALSPLHDSDLLKNGELEKPHYHLVCKFDGPISWNVANEICECINAYSRFQKVRNIGNIINYLTHDSYTSTDKFKYSSDDIEYINCSPYYFTSCEYVELLEIISNNDINSLSKLVNYLKVNKQFELLQYVIEHTYFFNCYLNNLRAMLD